MLDWRLGLDLAEIAADAAHVPTLTTGHWAPVVELARASLRQILSGGARAEVAGLPSLRGADGRTQAVFVHPLWSESHPAVVAAAQALATPVGELPLCSVFDALRRPGWVVSRLGKTGHGA